MAVTDAKVPRLTPITVAYGDDKIDMSVPGSVALGELLPALARALGRLDTGTATQGYHVVGPSSIQLRQDRTLEDQGLGAGTLLTLVPIGDGAAEQRYDDLIEAVGISVESNQVPWTRADSLTLSAHTASVLVVIAALLLISGTTATRATLVTGVISTLIVILTAALVARTESRAGSLSLFHTAPLLLGCAAVSVAPGHWDGATLTVVGVAVMLASLGALALPSQLWSTSSGPLAGGASLAATGLLADVVNVPIEAASASILALLTVLTLAAPWVAMAQVPVSVTGPAVTSPIDVPVMQAKVDRSHLFVLSLKAGTGVAAAATAPHLIHSGRALALLTCCGIALMLSTRSLRSRAEVLIGVLTGMMLVLTAALGVAINSPSWLLLLVGILITSAALLLAANVITPRMRPWLTRAADTVATISLLAILPTTALVWGVL